ncbi:hypothetical protein COU74_03495 [Candidatus Peregrinibacteria bacterium CG10_big_fil_rev_8_21_14_0_10_36_19]|nr:MAG: hypothetical protein COU74_03495 [Candidatus Peregrinibacteria bacterium CG10_big_fil_rev_8_21_14_0_10_36_19]
MKFKNFIVICVLAAIFLSACSFGGSVKKRDFSGMTGVEFSKEIVQSIVNGDKDVLLQSSMPFDFVLAIYKFKGIDFDPLKVEEMRMTYSEDQVSMVDNLLTVLPAAGVSNDADVTVDYKGYDNIGQEEREMLFSIDEVGQFSDVDLLYGDKLLVSLRVFQFNDVWYFFVK